MKPAAYNAFMDDILATLSADPHVIGLVAAGSTANQDHAPDEWSDHDFWIVTEPGAQEHYRATQDWLPQPDRIVLAYRETEHGVKVVYKSGHLVEYAVFDLAETDVMRVNSYRVLLDRGDLTAQVERLRTRTTAEAADITQRSDAFLFGQFLTNLLVGTARHVRGERLSGHDFVKHKAVDHLLALLVRHRTAPHPELLDNLDPLRRFELAFPTLGESINAAVLNDTPLAALALLVLAEEALAGRLADYPTAAVTAVRGKLETLYRP